ncbi:type II toxin-antitoxin system HigB family toxin [Pedobacter aquatilis]|uniref:type II toxin-antitoxin system HigB family toxin n=1 Tax=Pedobacter aquatilis TaxID=351343 RepID=UPI00292DDAF2|nr:type II toxin-antitoxin system HigB family toxin [Pedobacter aquatilis]
MREIYLTLFFKLIIFTMVRIVTINVIHEYIAANPSSGVALSSFVAILKQANWTKPQDIVDTFGSKAVDILGKKSDRQASPERAVIDVKGNHIRVIIKYQFHEKLKVPVAYIVWIGTHSEYDKINKKRQQFDINLFK